MKTRFFARLLGLAGVAVGFLFGTGGRADEATVIPPTPLATVTILAPKDGATFVAPGPVVIEAEAVDLEGDIRHLEYFANGKSIGVSDFLLKIATIPGRPIPHRLEWTGAEAGVYTLVARGTNTAGEGVDSAGVRIQVGAAPATATTFVPAGSEWRYLYTGAEVAAGWKAAGFDASAWGSGKAQLGFGEGDEATVIWSSREAGPITAYFRREFEVPADAQYSRMTLRLLRDDGAAVYLNGKEILRDNLPSGTLRPTTPATANVEATEFKTFALATDGLVTGRNVIAVEVHQAGSGRADLSFDLELTGALKPVTTPVVVGVEATVATTAEPSPTARIIPGEVMVRRTGSTVLPLLVGLAYGGTAKNGVDYEELPGLVVIPAGKSEVPLSVRAVDDDLVEDTESVVVKVATSPVMGPMAGYEIDPKRASAEVTIANMDKPPTAKLVLDQPENGASFAAGSTIVVRATAVDTEGYISRVEFFDGDTRVGVSELTFIRAPDPGTPIQHTFEWKGAGVGSHRLHAAAKATDGTEVRSEAVVITVQGAAPWLLNINFGGGEKTGPAATGNGKEDFWNVWEARLKPDVLVEGLKLADTTPTKIAVRVRNAGGIWGNRSGDPMYDSYIYPNNGKGDGVGDIVVNLEGVPAGAYDLFLYGHADPDGRPESDSVFGVTVDDMKLGPLGTKSSAGWKVADGWTEGAQYVVFRRLDVGSAGAVEVVVQPGYDGGVVPGDPARHVAILNGLQLVKSSVAPPRASLVINAPKDGATVKWGKPLEIVATAILEGGTIHAVEFLDGDTVLGQVTLPMGVLWIPGAAHEFKFVWTVPTPGEHKISARAVLPNDGQVTAEAVRVNVTAPEAPTLVIESPRSGEHYLSGALVKVRAVAVDPKGYVSRVEFFDGDKSVGVSELVFLVAPKPGTPITHTIEWKGVTPGDHKLIARAVSSVGNALVSEPVPFSVGDLPPPASLVIQTPRAGAHFEAGTMIEVEAVAVDPLGYIPRVEFFDRDTRIGVSEIAFLVAPEPGTPITHAFEWKDAGVGEHRLTARAKTSAGVAVESAVVPILVTKPGADQVVVEVAALDAEASEPDGTVPAKVGRFRIHRAAGDSQVAVSVAYKLDGGAINGVDYAKLGGEVVLPKGAEHVDVTVTPLADTLTEGDEKVVLVLQPIACIAIYPPPPECYRIGARSEAVVVIHDGVPANRAPKVAVTAPKSGATYLLGEAISVTAEASDADGSVVRLDLLADGQVIGSAKQSPLALDWKGATRGTHRLTARALDDRGKESTSSTVLVYVRDVTDLAFVGRELPSSYLPGAAFEVVLRASPPRGAQAWTVEETPPAGWSVAKPSHDGVWDAAAGVIRYGPFTDRRTRELAYEVTPATDAKGVQKFAGTTSLDGRSLPVVGEDTVAPAGEFHPADAAPGDHVIKADELTAYAAAWRSRKPWGDGGELIPASYVMRAGLIWSRGGKYAFDVTKGAPPACWVPVKSVSLADGDPPPVPVGEAVRRSSSSWAPGVGAEVVLVLTPPAGTAAVCVEETVPVGWTVTQASDGGEWDAEHHQVRWGVFFGDTPKELRYTVVPPAGVASNGTFTGLACYDDAKVTIGGFVVGGAADAATEVRIAASQRVDGDRVRFQVQAVPEQVLTIEASSDLRTWSDVDGFVFDGEELEVSDPGANGAAQRYYRIRPEGR